MRILRVTLVNVDLEEAVVTGALRHQAVSCGSLCKSKQSKHLEVFERIQFLQALIDNVPFAQLNVPIQLVRMNKVTLGFERSEVDLLDELEDMFAGFDLENVWLRGQRRVRYGEGDEVRKDPLGVGADVFVGLDGGAAEERYGGHDALSV